MHFIIDDNMKHTHVYLVLPTPLICMHAYMHIHTSTYAHMCKYVCSVYEEEQSLVKPTSRCSHYR